MKQSLGLIEVRGLALAVNVADAMAKSAAIKLVGVEKTNGGGWTVIKIIGDVAAVKSALNTGAALAEQFAGLVSQTALSRPDDHVLRMTVPSCMATPADPVPAIAPTSAETSDATPADRNTPDEVVVEDAVSTAEVEPVATASELDTVTDTDMGTDSDMDTDDSVTDDADDQAAPSPTGAPTASCNLCHDPLCPRQKGEPRHKCLHIRG